MVFQKIKKMITTTLVSICSFFSLSCGDNTIRKDGLLYGEIVGELYHTQYWNSNDSWDLKNMYLILHYDDETIYRLQADDSNAHYTFFPESPNGLPLGSASFGLVSGYYKDYKGIEHEIKPRMFDGVTIVNNPNVIVKTDTFAVVFRTCIEVVVLTLIPVLLIFIFFQTYKRKREE